MALAAGYGALTGSDLPSQETLTGTVQGYSIDGRSMAFDLQGGGSTGFHLSGGQVARRPAPGTALRITVVHIDGHRDIVVSMRPTS